MKAEGCRPLPSRRRRRQRWTSWRHNSARSRSAGAATALDVVDEDDDPKVRLARVEWKLRLDGATNELEDLVGEMEEAVEAEKKARCWAPWRRRCRGAAEVVAGWLRSDARNKVRMELAVGRLAGVYVQGGELFDDDDDDDVAGDGDGTAASQCRDGGACQSDGMAGKTTKASLTRTNTSSSSSHSPQCRVFAMNR